MEKRLDYQGRWRNKTVAFWLDMELRRRLETKLIITVMTFKVA